MSTLPETSESLPPLLRSLCLALDDQKAGDVQVLRVREQSSITDFLVVATGTSDPHLRALRIELEKVIDASGTRILGMDTEQGSGWMVIDAFDIMVHVLTAENRAKYALENLWKDAELVPLEEVLAEPGSVKPKRKATKKAAEVAPVKKTVKKVGTKKTGVKKAAPKKKVAAKKAVTKKKAKA